MKLSDFFTNPRESLVHNDPYSQIVVSSRVRLARNLDKKAFPGWAKKQERITLMEEIKSAVESQPQMVSAFSERMENLTLLDKQVLVERHFISCEHAQKTVGSAIVMNSNQTLSVMINEEDHLRMQAILPGFQLREAFSIIAQMDTGLEEHLPFAFHPNLGYLTACPSNVGTGMRVSAMLHLPGLVLLEHMNKIINSVNKMGLVVRGLHGEGTDAIGNLFQISNQTTLGEKEEDIIERLHVVIQQIFQHETNARMMLLKQQSETLKDQIGRAYGILSHAYSITTKESLNLLSLMKLGIDLNLFPKEVSHHIDALFMEAQPAHLQKRAQLLKMTSKERDTLRATLIRDKLKQIPEPVLLENGSV
ncbi:MAG: protein arginine kinase [Chthoniobacterales bacterium]|nr:protein arginine kinase [Chthoniobacterales bacterium]